MIERLYGAVGRDASTRVPLRRRREIIPIRSMIDNADRTVDRLTPYAAASCNSLGSCAPISNFPNEMSREIF
jgi:hypothetical protein